jgi:ABC-type ATPase with predicted acetyltransferase domain
MGKKQKGATYKCEKCGLIVRVDEPCGCEPTCELTCCEVPMKEIRREAKK